MPSEQAVNNAQKREKRQKEKGAHGKKIKERRGCGTEVVLQNEKNGKAMSAATARVQQTNQKSAMRPRASVRWWLIIGA